jgi:hypothetical protein
MLRTVPVFPPYNSTTLSRLTRFAPPGIAKHCLSHEVLRKNSPLGETVAQAGRNRSVDSTVSHENRQSSAHFL